MEEKKMKKLILWLIHSKLPMLGRIYAAIFNKKGYYTFSGWGLTTTSSYPPWVNTIKDKKNIHNIFLEIDQDLKERIKNKKFFSTENRHFTKLSEHYERLEYLKWRHYILFITSLYAAQYTKSKNKTFVECGVGDGFSAYYAINALKKKKIKFKCYLYDSWSSMKKKYLNQKELRLFKDNKYDYLDFDLVKKNFKHDNNVNFIRGYLPQSLKLKKLKKISWLSIDLNSAKPTVAVLDHLYKKIEKGGVIILDDYGGSGYVETKLAVDIFFRKKKSIVFQFPTGQAMIIKS